jgi:hypothetical protein
MVGAVGFELTTLCSQSRCATRLRYAPTSLRFYIDLFTLTISMKKSEKRSGVTLRTPNCKSQSRGQFSGCHPTALLTHRQLKACNFQVRAFIFSFA